MTFFGRARYEGEPTSAGGDARADVVLAVAAASAACWACRADGRMPRFLGRWSARR